MAGDYANWAGLDVTVFTEAFNSSEADTVATLRDFDMIIARRERTTFRGNPPEQLPKLKLLVTTGMANDSTDMHAALDLGITVCGARRQ